MLSTMDLKWSLKIMFNFYLCCVYMFKMLHKHKRMTKIESHMQIRLIQAMPYLVGAISNQMFQLLKKDLESFNKLLFFSFIFFVIVSKFGCFYLLLLIRNLDLNLWLRFPTILIWRILLILVVKVKLWRTCDIVHGIWLIFDH